MPKRAAKESKEAPAPVEGQDEHVVNLRREMAKHDVQAYIVPSEDPHMVGLLTPNEVWTSWELNAIRNLIYHNSELSLSCCAERICAFVHGATALHQPLHRFCRYCRGHQ